MRGLVRISTKIAIADDPRGVRAARVVAELNRGLEEYWRGLDGTAYEAARARARSMGFDYAPASEIAARGIDEIVARVEQLLVGKRIEDPAAVAALLGGVAPPQIKLSDLPTEYEALMRGSLTDLSPDQRRKWRNPYDRAAANLITVIGDKTIDRVARGDALDFRDWCQNRIIRDGLSVATANRDIGSLNQMWRVVDDAKRLGLPSPFRELRIRGGRDGQRPAFAPEYVQDVLLLDGTFAGLNPEGRRVIYLIAETGLRLSEAVNLTRDTIRLNDTVPHVAVRPDGRRLKTDHSEREVPLVGVALAAMQAQPDGFPRYRDRGAALSAAVNKYMAENGLRPSPDHSLYSLRHTFEDRLTGVEAPEKLIAALMGHKFSRPKYGLGPSLAQKREWLIRIAFRPPSIV